MPLSLAYREALQGSSTYSNPAGLIAAKLTHLVLENSTSVRDILDNSLCFMSDSASTSTNFSPAIVPYLVMHAKWPIEENPSIKYNQTGREKEKRRSHP